MQAGQYINEVISMGHALVGKQECGRCENIINNGCRIGLAQASMRLHEIPQSIMIRRHKKRGGIILPKKHTN